MRLLVLRDALQKVYLQWLVYEFRSDISKVEKSILLGLKASYRRVRMGQIELTAMSVGLIGRILVMIDLVSFFKEIPRRSTN
jgi:hypothetical protein